MTVLQILARILGILTLILIGIGLSTLALFYLFGVPWLPSTAHVSTSQQWLIGTYFSGFITFAGWLGLTIFRWLLSSWRSGNSQAKTPKPQSVYPSRSQALSGTYQDPIVIGGGRERNNSLFWFGVLEGPIFIIASIFSEAQREVSVAGWVGPHQGLFSPSMLGYTTTSFILLGSGLILILGGIAVRPFGKRRECLKIGSEGMAHYIRGKGNVFIPWDDMSRAYIDTYRFFSRALYVILEDDSGLIYEKSIHSRHKSIGTSEVVMICEVSKSQDALIPENVVQRALQRYAPPGIL